MLKNLFLISLIWTNPPSKLLAENVSENDSIEFRNLDFKMALSLAKSQNMPLCVFLTDEEAASKDSQFPSQISKETSILFNSNFINCKIPLHSQKTRFNFAKVLGIGVPWQMLRVGYLQSLLFYDADGNLVHFGDFSNLKSESEISTNASKLANQLLSKVEMAKNFAERFNSGESDPTFLVSYSKFLFLKEDMEAYKNLVKESVQRFITAESMVNQFTLYVLRTTTLPYRHSLFQGFVKQIPAFKAKFGSEIVKEVGACLYGIDMGNFTTDEIKNVNRYFLELGQDQNWATSATYKFMINAFQRDNDFKGFIDYANTLLDKKPFGEDQIFRYLTVMQNFNKSSLEKLYFQQFETWSDQIIRFHQRHPDLNNETFHALTNYEMAEIYWRHGDKSKARGLAYEAYTISRSSNNNMTQEEKDKIASQFSKYRLE